VHVSDAAEMFKGLDRENKTFTLMHCWNKLKGEDKWKAKRKRMAEQQASKNKKKQKINADSTPANVQSITMKMSLRFHHQNPKHERG